MEAWEEGLDGPVFGGEEDEDYEDLYVVLELPEVHPQFLTSCDEYQLIGLNTPTPFLKLGTAVFKGTHEDTLGTSLVFSKDDTLASLPGSYELPPAEAGRATAANNRAKKAPADPFKLVASSTQKIAFTRVLVEPREHTDEPVTSARDDG